MLLRVEDIQEKLKKLFSKKGFGLIALAALSGLILLLIPNENTEPETEISGVFSSEDYCAMLEAKAERLIKEYHL